MKFYTGKCINSSCKEFGQDAEVQAEGVKSDMLIGAECASCHSRMRHIFTAPSIRTSKTTRNRRQPPQQNEGPQHCEECDLSDNCPVPGVSETFEKECKDMGRKPLFLAGTITPDGRVITAGISVPDQDIN